MGHSTSSGRQAPGISQERLDTFINRQRGRRILASDRQVNDFARELEAMNVGDYIEATTTGRAGTGQQARTSVVTFSKTRNGWEYRQTINGETAARGSIPNTQQLANDILFDARSDAVTWRVGRR